MEKEELVKQEKMIVMYDPTVDAYREVPLSLAKKFCESAREVEKKLKEEE